MFYAALSQNTPYSKLFKHSYLIKPNNPQNMEENSGMKNISQPNDDKSL